MHGVPKTIVSDRDPTFISHFWVEYFRLQGTQLKMSSAYHPETDGQSEVLNRCLETYLRCFASEQPRFWADWIAWAEYWYNTSFHSAIQLTPFEAVYGRPPPPLIHYLPGETSVEAVAQELKERDEIIRQLKYNLTRAQQRMVKYANLHRRDVSFDVGEFVFVKLRPHRQQTVVKRVNQKLAARYFGPFQILQRLGSVAYKLQLPEGTRVHPVFHVSQLKRALGTNDVAKQLPSAFDSGFSVDYKPKQVLAVRRTHTGEEIRQQVFIHWEGQSEEDATWEDWDDIALQFPQFSLGDKAVFNEEGIVSKDMDREREPIFKVYTRRPKVQKIG